MSSRCPFVQHSADGGPYGMVGTASAVFIVLIAAAVVAWFFARGAMRPAGEFNARLAPDAADTEVFMGCIGQTGEPKVFVISVSRREEKDPLPAGSPVPREPTGPAGVPLSGGTPEQPPLWGTGELPVAGGTPTTRTETYVLDGSGGLALSDHVGHAIEVTGALEQTQDRRFLHLHVSSARHIADVCRTP